MSSVELTNEEIIMILMWGDAAEDLWISSEHDFGWHPGDEDLRARLEDIVKPVFDQV